MSVLCSIASWAWFSLCTRAVLVSTDNGEIDHRIFIAEIFGETLIDATSMPACMARENYSEISEPLRQNLLREPRAMPVQHRFDKQPVVLRLTPTVSSRPSSRCSIISHWLLCSPYRLTIRRLRLLSVVEWITTR